MVPINIQERGSLALHPTIVIAIRVLLIAVLGFTTLLFHALYKGLRRAGVTDKPMRRLFLSLLTFTSFLSFVTAFWLIHWLQMLGCIAIPLSLESFGVVESLINLGLAILVLPVYVASRRVFKNLKLLEELTGRIDLIHMSGAVLRHLRRRLSAMFGDKSASNILYALGMEEGQSFIRATKIGVGEPLLPLPSKAQLSSISRLVEVEGLAEKCEFKFDGGGERVEAILYGSVEAEGVESGVPVCNFLSGWLAGVFGKLTGLQASAVEEECIAKGDPYCRIRIRLGRSLESIKEE